MLEKSFYTFATERIITHIIISRTANNFGVRNEKPRMEKKNENTFVLFNLLVRGNKKKNINTPMYVKKKTLPNYENENRLINDKILSSAVKQNIIIVV